MYRNHKISNHFISKKNHFKRFTPGQTVNFGAIERVYQDPNRLSVGGLGGEAEDWNLLS